ncbi:MAG TPA: nucleotidyltransferase family protein [Candidatus Acidoferrales bacterium]|nr:nucleotidyltransferase family protein [Candidatus Acidoferrales bacterium]
MPDHERDLARELLSLCLVPSRHAGRPVPLPGRGGLPPRRDPPSAAPAAAPADWDALIQFAIQQGVAPLLAVRTRHLALPVIHRERLETIYSANSLRNLRLAAEESRVSAALAAAGLRHWPLKGPGLSERLYADIGVRQISDLDLLIEPASLARTDALLADLGYRRNTAGKIESLARAQELLYIRDVPGPPSPSPLATSHSPLATAFYLDLHQRLLPYVRRDPLAARVFADGMTNENLLLYLCASQITHRFARLRYLCDVAAFLAREGGTVDWDKFSDTARRIPWGPGVGLALHWAEEFTPARVPPAVLHTLRPNPIGDLLLRRALGADAAEAASRARALDGPAGASVALGAAYLGRPAACGIAWRMMFPTRAYLREQSGTPASDPLAAAYASRLIKRIPAALRHLLKTAP